MTMKYIRDYYGVPAYRGRRVIIDDGSFPMKEGVIVGSTGPHVKVRLDSPNPDVPMVGMPYHPRDLIYHKADYDETGKELGSDQPGQIKPLI